MGKGDRREREAVDLLEQAGYWPFRPATYQYGENDPWGLFDILAIDPDCVLPFRAVQVKSNRATGIRSWREETEIFRNHGFVTEFWVPVDHKGWRIIDCRSDTHTTVVDEREQTGVFGDGVVEYLRSGVA